MSVSEGFGSWAEGANEDAERWLPCTRYNCPVPAGPIWCEGYRSRYEPHAEPKGPFYYLWVTAKFAS